jgi:hypothetical protein
MSETLRRVRALVVRGEYRVSRHGFRELAADDILVEDVLAGIEVGVAIEDHPDFHTGPSGLAMQHDRDGRPIHVVWGIPRDRAASAVLVTAYRPTPELWSSDFMKRKEP